MNEPEGKKTTIHRYLITFMQYDWRHDIQHNDIQRDDIKYIDTQHAGHNGNTKHKWHST